jgi:serine protease inhibitor
MVVGAPTSQIIFGGRLLQQLLQRDEENVFVSPASVGLALGMAAGGAQGKTLAALEHVLGVDAKLAANRATRLFASIDTLPADVVVELANSLWARSDLPVSARYKAVMRESYRAEVRNIDFTLPGATTLVNDWVQRATHGHIAGAVDQIDPSSILALVSATYFHGLWDDPFDPDDTVDHEFTRGLGLVTQVRLMSKSASFDYTDDPDLQVVRLRYKQGRFSLLLVLPRKPLSPAAFHDIASASSLARILAALTNRPGTLRMPKVRLAYATDLKPELLEMGMGPAFAKDADFSGVFDRDSPAFISNVLHKTRLEIDEKGTTAAASTVIEYSLSASIEKAPTTPFEMTVDRPFLLALTESETDVILFLGVIGDPTPPSSR